MTDDDVSEFAEFLWDVCAEFPPNPPGGCVGCPLDRAGLLAGDARGYLLDAKARRSFIVGYDGKQRWPANELGDSLVDLGRRFREQALSGEGFR